MDNYIRLVAAQLYSQLYMQAAQDLFEKSWYRLTADEQMAVKAAIGKLVVDQFDWLTPEYLSQLELEHPQRTKMGEQKPRTRVRGFEKPEKKD